ncbi:MAG: hypothetical protein HQL30_07195, partial [Candidatus Omnitrophica bacterium]|nr:hypothetical protein [Candidatus Omnitrophota bacterium]
MTKALDGKLIVTGASSVDVNRDGLVDISDLRKIVDSIGLDSADTGYDSYLDISGDGNIDALDVILWQNINPAASGAKEMNVTIGQISRDYVIVEYATGAYRVYDRTTSEMLIETTGQYMALGGKEFIVMRDASGITALAEILAQDINKDGYLDSRDKDAIKNNIGSAVEADSPDIIKRANLDGNDEITLTDLAMYYDMSPESVDMQQISVGAAILFVGKNEDGKYDVWDEDMNLIATSGVDGVITIDGAKYEVMRINSKIFMNEKIKCDVDGNNLFNKIDLNLIGYAAGSAYIEPFDLTDKGKLSKLDGIYTFDVTSDNSGYYNVGIEIPATKDTQYTGTYTNMSLKVFEIGEGGQDTLLGYLNIKPSRDMMAMAKLSFVKDRFTVGEHKIRVQWVNSSHCPPVVVSKVFLEDTKYIATADLNSDSKINAVDNNIFKSEYALESLDNKIVLYDKDGLDPKEYVVSIHNTGSGPFYRFTQSGVTGTPVYHDSDASGKVALGPESYTFVVSEEAQTGTSDLKVVLKRINMEYTAGNDLKTVFVGDKVYFYSAQTNKFTEKVTETVIPVGTNGTVTLGDPAVEYRVFEERGKILLYELQDKGVLTGNNVILVNDEIENASNFTAGTTVTRGQNTYTVSLEGGEIKLNLALDRTDELSGSYVLVGDGVYGITEPSTGNYVISSVANGKAVTVDNQTATATIGGVGYTIELIDGVRIKLVKVKEKALTGGEKYLKIAGNEYVIVPAEGGEYRITSVYTPSSFKITSGKEVEYSGVHYEVEKGPSGELVLNRKIGYGTEIPSDRLVKLDDHVYRVTGGGTSGNYSFTPMTAGAPAPIVDNSGLTVTIPGGRKFKIASVKGSLELLFPEVPLEENSAAKKIFNIGNEYFSLARLQPGVYTVRAESSGASSAITVSGTALAIGDRAFTITEAQGGITLYEVPDTVTSNPRKLLTVEGGIYEASYTSGAFTLEFVDGTNLAPVVDNAAHTVRFSPTVVYRIWRDAITGEINMEPYIAASQPR